MFLQTLLLGSLEQVNDLLLHYIVQILSQENSQFQTQTLTLTLCSPGIYQFSVPELTKVGSSVGRIEAGDADIGRNAEMDYTVVGGEGLDVFDISTDRNTQEGILSVKKVQRIFLSCFEFENGIFNLASLRSLFFKMKIVTLDGS